MRFTNCYARQRMGSWRVSVPLSLKWRRLMAAGSTFSVWAWLLLFGGGGGLPLPLSLPPLPEDPAMSAVAPEECLWYLTWSGCAKADPASKNQTEQLLAEEEVQRFGSDLERRLIAAV